MFIYLRNGMAHIHAGDGGGMDLPSWLALHEGQVFKLFGKGGIVRLHSLGLEADACREPLNIVSRAPEPLDLISNFANTPFDLDGLHYASVEGFWQGLKFPAAADRRTLAPLSGSLAKAGGYDAPRSDSFDYAGAVVRVGTWEHWQLMERACSAKFSQNEPARRALLSTGTRPLAHRTRRDSRTIPGVLMADIWMRIRAKLRSGLEHDPKGSA